MGFYVLIIPDQVRFAVGLFLFIGVQVWMIWKTIDVIQLYRMRRQFLRERDAYLARSLDHLSARDDLT